MKVDWQAYYHRFRKVHGDPVEYLQGGKGKSAYLLFADGWRYGRTDYSGPEYPPPEDPKKHLELIKTYWTIRKEVLQEQYDRLHNDLQALILAQQRRSAPLQVRVEIEQKNNLKQVIVQDVDFDNLIGKLDLLKKQLAFCKQQLENPQIPETAYQSFRPAGVLTKLEKVHHREDGS